MLPIIWWLDEVGRACPLRLAVSWLWLNFTNQVLHVRAVGETRSRTVAQTHAKRAHETVKGGPVSP